MFAFTIDLHHNVITFAEEENPANALAVSTADLLLLQNTLTQAIFELSRRSAAQTPDATLTPGKAVARAKQRGYDILRDTIRVAAKRGTIQGAYQQGTRWYFPVWAFDLWLDAHVNRADYRDHSQ